MADITDRLLAVADAAAQALSDNWSPIGPDAVHRDYLTEAAIAALTGRQVYVKPTGCGRIERLDRAEVINEHRVSVRMLERYEPAGTPPKDWIDQRVSWIGVNLYRVLYFEDPAAYLLGSLWTESADIVDAASEQQLLEGKLFWCELEFSFREIAAN